MEFVVGASDATMKSLLGKLGGLLAQEYTVIRGVRGDIQYISDELATMQAFLGDLGSTRDGRDRRLKDWMKQIRDMAYDMEDCIDDFAHRLPHDSLSDARCSFIVTRVHELWTFWPRREIASKISELKVRAQQIAERRSRYGLDNPTPFSGNGNGNIGSSATTGSIAEHLITKRQLIHTEQPVGAVTNMTNLREWLKKHSDSVKHRSVLSIVGFGGVGKTTIATALYVEFRNEFDCRALVTVSQNYDEDQVLRDILGQIKPTDTPAQIKTHERELEQESTGRRLEKSLAADIMSAVKRFLPLKYQGSGGSSNSVKNKIEAMSRDQLVEELKTRLHGKRYLLLVDDVWSAETWEHIRNCLPHDNIEDSRVIVTTRFQAVGASCSERDGTDHLHRVSVLTGEDSSSLFNLSVHETVSARSEALDGNSEHNNHSEGSLNHSVSESENHISSDNKEALEEICQFCGGLPLTIVSIAGLVACNPEKKSDYWSKIFKSLFPEQASPLTLDGVTRILDYCYNDLPPDLKTCSLYLSIFPKGVTISRKRLTRRWISECFVTEKQGLTAEEVAETYFNQLIGRKIIRPVDHSSNGKVKSFKVHDMILEYIVSKSGEENFITVVGGHWLMPTPSNKVRRLSMQSSGSNHVNMTKGMNLSQVRSLTVFGSQNRRLPFHSFNNGIIQVLDLEGWKGLEQTHLNDICKMVVLKYLSLRRTDIYEIPSKIEKLQYLETLDIRETNVGVLPKSFGQLKFLRSMLGGSKSPPKALKLPQEKNNEPMKALRILSGIQITDEDTEAVASLHQLTGLRKLAIYKLNIKDGSKAFKQLVSAIEYLCSCGLQTLAINDEGSEFINSLDTMSAPPRYLIALELSGKMERTPIWIQNLDNLYKLTLSVTVLQTETFSLIQNLNKLFCLTFTHSAGTDDSDIVDILEENKQHTDREIIVPPGGFKSLKMLRFFATLVPRLSFAVTGEEVMPALERIDMNFQAFEGIYGIETLKSLREVRLAVANQADEITKFLVKDMKDQANLYVNGRPIIISD
ncbi:disease resistance protein Pik-2-like [Lolium rigidum]|uniref:disease resistance protein Pik-2-like n=1 Tax=Lolium rigidum TaxID=89674 RepID=UPI001F5DFA04|nr:disease resistance protein Pik-2-like [Lolium rigidum]XP_047071368.1 disease resistance protein Pik-2-like [Lolium rigidum]